MVMVQEYASKGDLCSLFHRLKHSLSERQVQALVVRPLLKALAYMHARGICHRDVKPGQCARDTPLCLCSTQLFMRI